MEDVLARAEMVEDVGPATQEGGRELDANAKTDMRDLPVNALNTSTRIGTS